MRTLSILLLLVLTAGCVSQYQGNEDSPYYVIPAGSSITLNQDLTFAPDEVGLYFQGGKQVPKMQIDLYRPHCKLELKQRLETAQVVKSGEFKVLRATQEIIHSVGLPVRLASNVAGRFSIGGGDSSIPGPELYATRLKLSSARQPHVLSLNCGHLESPPVTAVHLTIHQIRQALGQIFTLKISG